MRTITLDKKEPEEMDGDGKQGSVGEQVKSAGDIILSTRKSAIYILLMKIILAMNNTKSTEDAVCIGSSLLA